MAWILGIVILILITGFAIYQLSQSNESARRLNTTSGFGRPNPPPSSDDS